MRLRLGERVFLILIGVNLATFAGAGLYLVTRLGIENERLQLELAGEVLSTLQATILPQGGLNVPRILTWSGWGQMEDAVLVDANLSLSPAGEVRAGGIALNPLGRARRDATLEQGRIGHALLAAIQSADPAAVAGGRVVPIVVEGRVWGACWYRPIERSGLRELVRALLPAFLISTSLLVGASFLTLRRVVLVPVEGLVEAAWRLQRGELGVRAPEGQGTDELSELVRTFNAMAASLESFQREVEERVESSTEHARRAEAAAMIQRRLASMGELAAGIAHEVNNPLGGLINAAEALARADLAPERRARYQALLADGLERIRLTVGRLLSMAPREARRVPFDLADCVSDVLQLVRHRAERQGVALVSDLSLPGGSDRRVLGIPNEIGQVVLNLVGNALDALEAGTPSGAPPAVRLELERRGTCLCLAVEDNGPGVEADELRRLPDLFYTTKDPGRGSGLGLSIVHRVVAQHGGRVLLSSEPGRFFRAEIELPAADGQGAENP